MDSELRARCIRMMMALKRLKPPFGVETELPVGEIMALHMIAAMHFRAEHRMPEDFELTVSDIQEELNVSKPAVSQILNSLESKGLVRREIGREDRRRVTVSLTAKGDALLLKFRRRTDMMLDIIIERFGVHEMREFLDRCDTLAEISVDVKRTFERGEIKLETDD